MYFSRRPWEIVSLFCKWWKFFCGIAAPCLLFLDVLLWWSAFGAPNLLRRTKSSSWVWASSWPQPEYPAAYWMTSRSFSVNSSSACTLASCPRSVPSPTSPRPRISASSHPVALNRNLCCFGFFPLPCLTSNQSLSTMNADASQIVLESIFSLWSPSLLLSKPPTAKASPDFTLTWSLFNGSSTLQPEWRFYNTYLLCLLSWNPKSSSLLLSG